MMFKGQQVVKKLFHNGYRLISMPHNITMTLPWLKSDTDHHFVQYAGNFVQTTSSGEIMDERTVYILPSVRMFTKHGVEYEQ